MNKLETIGKNIKIHRRALKWTQEQLAKHVGVSASIISKFELGTKPVDVITLIKIASALGVKYSELFRTDANKMMFHNIPVTVQEWDKLQTIASNKGFESDEVAEKRVFANGIPAYLEKYSDPVTALREINLQRRKAMRERCQAVYEADGNLTPEQQADRFHSFLEQKEIL